MKTVIIGAGVVGAALADELSSRGWRDITVVDQGDLPATGGSSSHAPGLVFQASPSKALTEMAKYTVEKFVELHHQGNSCFLQVGGLEVATTVERVAELHRRHGWLTSWGIESRILERDECVQLHPLLDRNRVLAGLHTPTDGIAQAVGAVSAQLERAQSRGVTLLPRHEVLDITRQDGRVTGINTDQGAIAADLVVCCAGIWGPKVAGFVGMTLPLTPLGHQFAWTTPLPALEGQQAEAVRPILRHQDQDLYYRDRYDTLGIGYYGHRPMPVDAYDLLPVDQADPMPSILEFTPEDFEPAWAETNALLPATAAATLSQGINGIFSFTPDGMPLVGQSPDVAGFWVAEAVWVTHSAGVAAALADWLVVGHSTYDLHEFDVNRFEDFQLAPAYVLERDQQNFVEVYDILHPLQPMDSPRQVRTSPFYTRQQELAAFFLPASGWERPQWYAANAPLLEKYDVPQLGDWASRYWSPIAGAEAQATREGVALYDMTALKRFTVTGPGSTELLQRLTTSNIAKSVGAVTYTLMLGNDGGIRSDITVARLAENHYQVGANGMLDIDWLRQHAPSDGSAQITDITAGTCCIGVWGPRAREVVSPLTDVDLGPTGLKYFRAAQGYLGTIPVTLMRLSYVGELGWEIYASAAHGAALWDALWESGREHSIIAGGRAAFNSLRLEKGYRSFGTDMTYEHDPYQAGLGFAVRLDQSDFIGREALIERKDNAPQTLACLVIDDPADTVVGKEPVCIGDAPVGYVTSAAWGHTIGKGIAYAWLPTDAARPGTEVQIGYFDRLIPATVSDEPLFDPEMTRLRG